MNLASSFIEQRDAFRPSRTGTLLLVTRGRGWKCKNEKKRDGRERERERISCHYRWIDKQQHFSYFGCVWSRWQIRAAAVYCVSIVEPLICPSSLALWLLHWGIYSPWWIALLRPQQSTDLTHHCTRVPLECLAFFLFLLLNQTEQALSLDKFLLARNKKNMLFDGMSESSL